MIVYLTGSSGFVGSNLLLHFNILGIKCVRLYSSAAFPNQSSEAISISDFISGKFRGVTTDEKQIFVHVGWGGVLGKSRNNIEQYDNISTTLKLFKIALDRGFSHFISIGSQAEYSNTLDTINECTHLFPETDYGMAKAITFKSMTDLEKYNQKRILTHARIFDVYGLGDNPNWLLPSLIAALQKKQPFALSSCQQIWNFTHISDLTSAIIALIEAGPSGPINICSDENLPLKQYMEIVAEVLNGKNELLSFGTKEHHSKDRNISGSNEKLKLLTNWKPKIYFREGISKMLLEASNYA
jgi:UDP-glucose 4-epimerase